MADLERTYNIPLRKEFLKVPRYRRAKKAVTAVREFLQRHMKSEQILIGQELNHEIWEKGIKNPPHHVKVTAVKDAEGVVKAELAGHEFKSVVQKEKSVEDTSLMGRMKKKMGVDEASIAAEEEKEAAEKEKAEKKAPAKEEKAAEKPVAEKPAEKKEAKPAEKKEAKPAEKPKEAAPKEEKQATLSEKAE